MLARPPGPPAAPGGPKPPVQAIVPLNRVRTGGGRGGSVPQPPGPGVPGWFGRGGRWGPPVALRQSVFRWGQDAVTRRRQRRLRSQAPAADLLQREPVLPQRRRNQRH